MTDNPCHPLYGPYRHQSCDTCAYLWRFPERRCSVEHIEFYSGGYFCADYHSIYTEKDFTK